MDFQKEYKKKLVTVDDILAKIKSNDIILPALVGCEPTAVLQRIHEIDNRVENVRIYATLEFNQFPFKDPNVDVKNIKTMSYFLEPAVGGCTR